VDGFGCSRSENREPLLSKAGFRVLSYATIPPTESMRQGKHNDAWTRLQLVVACPA
jgi:hypothetical protein